jgi:hypothetical protein
MNVQCNLTMNVLSCAEMPLAGRKRTRRLEKNATL